MILLIMFIMCIMTALSSENVNHHHNQQQQSVDPNYQSSSSPLNLPPSLSPSFLTPPTISSKSNSNQNNVYTSNNEYNNNDINNFYKNNNNNNLSSQDGSINYKPYEQRVETYMVPIIFAFIFLIGSISNGLTILIIFRERLYRSPSYLFILNLSLGDLIVILGSLPFAATIYTFESWPYGETVCKLSEFIRDVSVSVTVFTLTVMSYDRYKATFALSPRSNLINYSRPTTGNRRHPPPIGPTPFHVKLLSLRYGNIVTGIWIVSAIIGLPAINAFILNLDLTDGKIIQVCYPFPVHLGTWYPKIVISVKFLILYLIPLTVICFCYTLISLKLHHYSKTNSSLANPEGSRLQSGFKLTTSDPLTRRHRFRRRIVIFFVVAFAICFFPNHVYLLWFYWNPDGTNSNQAFWHVWRIVGYILSFTNSCLNPIILYLTSQRFRAETKNYLSQFMKKYYKDDNHHNHDSPHQQHQPEGCDSPVRTY
ncbi:neuropeptide CCHamide-1 receptor [Tetranychus urticae]|uniref:neuropeptide CCHamide-1 receptor n=1 Tax=Tetranychus urticae TaxID=32264 RepID=UPI00077B9E57|nr:neuropeptide CCHamide-1 receptor [Tetranychus urticae]